MSGQWISSSQLNRGEERSLVQQLQEQKVTRLVAFETLLLVRTVNPEHSMSDVG